jgi:nucleoside-diphosphate-sugar epimerase
MLKVECMQKIVVTGASGFLAKYIINELTSIGCHIIPVSRTKLKNTIQVESYKNTPNADMLIHLAEDPDRKKVNKIGKKYIEYSSDVVMALIKKFGKNVIYASSATVYGDQGKAPYTTNSPVYVTDVYNESKLTNERIVLKAGGSVLRLSNVYGVGMSTNNVMSDIVMQLQNDKVIVNDDSPIRDFISAVDVAKLISKMVQGKHKGIINVGSGVPISIHQLIKVFLKANGQKNKEVISRNISNRSSINVLDISDTQKMFGWIPSMDLEKNLRLILKADEDNI